MRVRDHVCYWPSENGLLVSKDEGKSWAVPGQVQAGVVGPLWGKTSEHYIVVAKFGFHETKDGGASWKLVAKLPEGFSAGGVGPNYAWDAHADIFYASSMGKDTLRYRR